ncbi:hypothetical protein M8J76_012793 [Diaphorina citri]|nr:hypothetical protein M8J76_012793 [Diaphorina citri]
MIHSKKFAFSVISIEMVFILIYSIIIVKGKHHSGLSGKKSNVLEEEQKTKIEKGIEDGKGREGKEEKEEKDGGGAGNGIYKYFHFTRCSKRVAERKRTSSTFARVSTG